MPSGTASPAMTTNAIPIPSGAHEIIPVDDRVIACDGGEGALGHPRVWLRIVTDHITCPYCSRVYVLNEGAGHDHGH
jgi:uncharacterized Zn-finger protein